MFIGLGIFTFISGLLIDLKYSQKIKDFSDILSFYKKRAIRILPMSWVSIILFIFFTLVLIPFFLPNFVPIYPKETVNFLWIFSQLFGFQLLIQNFATLFWFVGFIIICYITYPFLIKFSKGIYQIIILALIPLFIFGALRITLNLVDDRFFFYYMIFVVGVVANRFRQKLFNASYDKIVFFMILTYIFLFIFFWSGTRNLISIAPSFDFVIRQMLVFDIAIISGCVFLLMLLARHRIYNILERGKSVITFVAVSSFCIYLFHYQFFTIGEAVLQFFNLSAIANESLFFVVIIPITFISCYCIQKTEIFFQKNFSQKKIELKN